MLQPKLSILAVILLAINGAVAQPVSQKLMAAFQRFERDPQLQYATVSLYVTDTDGHVIFQKNAGLGVAPASTQKVVTSAAAYALLGASFRYKTQYGLLKKLDGSQSLFIKGSGDPSLGSWRWAHTRDTTIINRVVASLNGQQLNDTVYVDTTGWNDENLPPGWIWEDIGNYYGAGASSVNWRENQYTIYLKSGMRVGDLVSILGSNIPLANFKVRSDVRAAAGGTGDNAFIYFSLTGDSAVVRGTIPVGENHFAISGALPNPARQFAASILQKINRSSPSPVIRYLSSSKKNVDWFYESVSPPLDSLMYWFNRKSINLYGEAFLKTMGFLKTGFGTTEDGLDVLIDFWKAQGLPPESLNLTDGSGLSPLNRLTTKSQAAVLQFARRQLWFKGFYNSLPEYNGMKLKSGTIHGVKAFAGYYTSRAGANYVISFIVNNYNGSAATLVDKMYTVLNMLK